MPACLLGLRLQNGNLPLLFRTTGASKKARGFYFNHGIVQKPWFLFYLEAI